MPRASYRATPPLSTSHEVRVDSGKVAAALRAFFRILEAWGVRAEDAIVLLGRPGRSTMYKWKRGDVRTVPHDTVRRVSYVLGIYRALQILFPDPARADAWVRRPNEAFGGQSALDRMLAGDVTDLATVRRHLDAVLEG